MSQAYDSQLYDVVIIGGSFAGLATAMQLRGHRVLLLDPYPIGSHPVSACGTPLTIASAVGAEAAIQEVHPALVLHTGGAEIPFNLRDPYVTFDYQTFCQAMLVQTDAEVWQTRAVSFSHAEVVTEGGTVSARFVVNAAGWRLGRGPDATAPGAASVAGYGLETELPIRLDIAPGLHFYVERKLVPNGYAWIFPSGKTTRIGVGSFAQDVKLRPKLAEFLQRFGLRLGSIHGGVLAIELRAPVAEGVFYAGDAAGHCLPVTGEGIRTALFHGIHCGQAIANALDGGWSPDGARTLYGQQVRGMDRFHARLLKLQMVVAHTPEPFLAWAARLCSSPSLTHRILAQYLTGSGWFLGQPA